MKLGTAIKLKKIWAGHEKSQMWTDGAEETQYSSVMEIRSEGVDWINLAQGMDRRRTVVNTEWILTFLLNDVILLKK